MGLDRFIDWKEPPEWGAPTIKRIAAVAQDYLGRNWVVTVNAPWIYCRAPEDMQSFHLLSERPECAKTAKEVNRHTRYFEIYFSDTQTSVITRQADEFTCYVASGFAEVIARWWNGEVRKP